MFEIALIKVQEMFIQSKEESNVSPEEFRLTFLSRKGQLSELIYKFSELPPEEKRKYGKVLNELKTSITSYYELLTESEEATLEDVGNRSVDSYVPVAGESGALHPLTQVQQRIKHIFQRLGFNVSEGPEVEEDWYNFGALNFGDDHPARDMQDTFFIHEKVSLRTHTSSVQVRVMETQKPPIRKIMMGRVYRNEAISARSNCFFHQVEGLVIDEYASIADMKNTLFSFVKQLFGAEIKVRFRASFFPFTEPSAEMDISCPFCGQRGCNICKHSGWIEIMGCGMVDPVVLSNCGIDPEKYQGYAFGMGVDRIAMSNFGIKDIRDLFNNDRRILEQSGKIFS